MAFTIYNLFKATLLIINAMAVLHPGRFLKQCENWAVHSIHGRQCAVATDSMCY